MMEVGKETTKCGVGFGVGVVVVMEVTQVGVRTRDGAPATVTEATEDNSGAVKRRKLSNEKLRSPSSTFVETKPIECEIQVSCSSDAGAGSCRSGGVPASCCYSSGSMEQLEISDLEESVEIGANASNKLDESESTMSSELKDAGEPVSTAAKQSPAMSDCRRRVLPAEKMPAEAEIEEFFATAQEVINERFKNKYNYDIVNDIPLKGRFEWTLVNPRN